MTEHLDNFEIVGPQGERTLFIGDLFEQDVRAVTDEIMAGGNNLETVYNLHQTNEPVYVREVCLAAGRLWATYMVGQADVAALPFQTKRFHTFVQLCRVLDITAPLEEAPGDESP